MAAVPEAVACARVLSERGVVAVYSSPARRCVETASPIADATSVPVLTDDGLVERMNWARSSGMSFDDFLVEWQRATADRDYVPPIGASSRATGARMSAAITRLAEQHRAGIVVCVTHGGATLDLLRDVMGDAALERASPGTIAEGVPGGALTTLSVAPPGFGVEEVCSTRHL